MFYKTLVIVPRYNHYCLFFKSSHTSNVNTQAVKSSQPVNIQWGSRAMQCRAPYIYLTISVTKTKFFVKRREVFSINNSILNKLWTWQNIGIITISWNFIDSMFATMCMILRVILRWVVCTVFIQIDAHGLIAANSIIELLASKNGWNRWFVYQKCMGL